MIGWEKCKKKDHSGISDTTRNIVIPRLCWQRNRPGKIGQELGHFPVPAEITISQSASSSTDYQSSECGSTTEVCTIPSIPFDRVPSLSINFRFLGFLRFLPLCRTQIIRFSLFSRCFRSMCLLDALDAFTAVSRWGNK